MLRIIYYSIFAIIYSPHYLLYRLSKSRVIIEEDIVAYLRHKHYSYCNYINFILLLRDKYFKAQFYHRLGSLSKLISWYTPLDCTFIIGTKTIGGGFFAAHSYATIINAKSIGRNFSCRQCTTIGNKQDGRNDLVPLIGDDVTVGANAVIIGPISIGNNVIIGAGSVVTKDVPSNSVIAGNPARIIRTLDN